MKVRDFLKMSIDQYETMIFEFYGRWCESVTTDVFQYQSVLANKAINAWWLNELRKNERVFVETVSRYENLTEMDLKHAYNHFTFDVFNRRPLVLLEPIIKIKSHQRIELN